MQNIKLNEVRYEVWCNNFGFMGNFDTLKDAQQKANYLSVSPSYDPIVYEVYLRRERAVRVVVEENDDN